MTKLVNRLLSQNQMGEVIYRVFESAESMENAGVLEEFKEMVRGSINQLNDELRETNPTHTGNTVDPLLIVEKYYEQGNILLQYYNGQMSGFAVLSVVEAGQVKTCNILDIYISQNFQNQNFETLLVSGIVSNVKMSGIRGITITTTVADEALMDALDKNEFKPEEIKFRLNI